MVISQKYEVIDPESGMLDRSVFTDEAVYQEELEKIFGRAWLFIGHESLIPNPNDFFLTYMGEDPVILCRTAGGQVRAYLNMCRHRGNRIVRADDGNAKNFMCAYHGWTYSNEGKLVSVPGLQEAYYGELEVEALGLVEVAQLDSYAGAIFATWAEDAPSLEAYLGDARWYRDARFNHRDNGIQLIGPTKWILPANWKTPVENAVGDLYHAPLSHRSSTLVQMQFKRIEGPNVTGKPYGQPGNQVHMGNGHGGFAHALDTDALGGNRLLLNSWDKKLMEEYSQSIQPEVERRLGTWRARRLRTAHFSLFPNMFLGFRMAHPRGPLRTEIWSFEQHDMDAPEEVRRLERTQVIHGAGQPAGLAMQDDMDNWRNVSESGLSKVALRYRQHLAMGMGHEGLHDKMPGWAAHRAFSENNQRYYYARWQEFMNAESWGDIHVDPITTDFEGTATMKG